MERRIEVVVASPVFEYVAKQIKLAGMRRVLREEAEESFGRARMGLLQVQVRNEKRERARGNGPCEVADRKPVIVSPRL